MALAVIAVTVGVALGVWPNKEPAPSAIAPVTTSPARAPLAETPSAVAEPTSTATPEAPVTEASPTATSPKSANPTPSAPSAVTVAVVDETPTTVKVSVTWKVGSGNGRAINEHRISLRTDRGVATSWQVGAAGQGGTHELSCSGRVCDGLKLDAEVRAVSSAGTSAAGRGSLTYSAPYIVPRELRSNHAAPNPAAAQANARQALPGLRASILAAGTACTSWEEQVISVYTAPDGSVWVFAGIVRGICKY